MRGGEGAAEDSRGATNCATNTESKHFSGVTHSTKSGARAAKSGSSVHVPPPASWLGVRLWPGQTREPGQPQTSTPLQAEAACTLNLKPASTKTHLTGSFC